MTHCGRRGGGIRAASLAEWFEMDTIAIVIGAALIAVGLIGLIDRIVRASHPHV